MVPRKGGKGALPTVFYAVMVKEPLVGMPGAESELVPVRLVGLAPHMMVADQVKVSPMSPAGNVKLNCWLFSGGLTELVGATTSTVLVTVKPETPDPSDPEIWTCTYSVSLFGLLIPNFHCCTPPFLLIESLCLQLIWLKNGLRQPGVVLSGHPWAGTTTVTGTVVLCCTLPLVPVTVTE
jgi:hypothetical protein